MMYKSTLVMNKDIIIMIKKQEVDLVVVLQVHPILSRNFREVGYTPKIKYVI